MTKIKLLPRDSNQETARFKNIPFGMIQLRRRQKINNFVTPHQLHPQKYTIDLSV